ncbi:serine/threonine-protein kinase [Streptomyces sp. NPDC035033]|uniref:serine/threonine-protein kinase n=1 Tax=Streptomyces sp. NPDC035033 TaxID=3155368 RepID=UPI00340DA476
MHDLQPDDPASVGPYRLSARLGEGGMGQVFLAVSRSGRRLAVKVIRPQIAADPGFRERFRREVAAARTVGGFWTAPIVDADPDGPVPWVASDYIDAPDLAGLVRERGPLPEAEVRSLAAGLAEALEAVHRAGLVHRDLKPSNILVTPDGPRVIDFGISKAVEGATALTDTGLVVGTPGFMSPEQATGAPVGPSSDVFSLGAVLAYAATGRAPFGEGSVPALLYRVVHDAPDLDGVPPALLPLVADCLDRSPDLRPTPSGVLNVLLGPAAPAPATPPPLPRTRVDAAPAPPGADAAARIVEVTAGIVERPTRRAQNGGCLAALGVLCPVAGVPVGFALSLPVVTLTTVVLGLAALVTGLVVAGGQPLVRHTVQLTADHLHCRVRGRRWSSAWTDVSRVTVRPTVPGARGERRWQLAARLREGAPVPQGFSGKGEREAVMALHFDDSEDPVPALRRLDAGLRRHAGDRYSPDAVLTAFLDRPPTATSPGGPVPG